MIKTDFAAVLRNGVLCGLTAVLLVTATPAFAQVAAMVTDLTGKASVEDASHKGSLVILSEVAAGARVQLDNAARLTVVYLASGDEYLFAGPAQIQFRSNEPQVLNGAAPQKRASPLGKGASGITVKMGGVTQVGFVMRGGRTTGRIRLLSLASATTLETAPEFRWQGASQATGYHFKLTDDDGKVLYEAEVQGDMLRLPASIKLADEVDYIWELSALFADGRRYVSTGDFRVASAELRAEVEALRPASGASVAERVLFAAWLEHSRLRDEAKKYWKALSAERPDDAGLRALAGEVSHPPRTIDDITALLDQYKPDPAKVAAFSARVNREPPPEGDSSALAHFYLQRAEAAQRLGAVARQTADLRRAIELLKGTEGERSVMQDLFIAESQSGNFVNAMRIKEQMLRMPSSRPGERVTDYDNTVQLYTRIGDIAAARATLRNMEAAIANFGRRRQARLQDSPGFIAHLEGARAAVLNGEGKYVEAETAFRKALAADQRRLERAPQVIANRTVAPPLERFYNAVDSAEQRLAQNLLLQGRLAEAELAVRNVLQRRLSRLGRYAPGTAGAVLQFARILNEQGRFREGEAMARAAVEIYRTIGAAPESLSYVAARRVLSTALVMQGRWNDALAVYGEIRADLAQDPASRGLIRVGDANLPLALIKAGQAARALPLLESGLTRLRERYGASHYRVAEQRGFLGMALAEIGQRQRALAEFQDAIKVLLARGRTDADDETATPAGTWRLKLILEGYIKLLHDIRNELGQRTGLDPATESFRVADAVRGQNTQRALAASAARAAPSDPALSDLIRKEQDKAQLIAVLYSTLFRLLNAPADQQLPQVVAQMRQRIQDFEKERTQLFADLEKRFPSYVNLIHPQPATLEQARAALRDGEVLLSVLTTEERTYVWAIAKSGPVAFHAAQLGDRAITDLVSGLRKALDPGKVALEAVPDFDVAAAYRLYAELLKPVESAWNGAQVLMVVANGALAQLPFGLLPTEAAPLAAEQALRFTRYQSVPWLIKKLAVTQLPAVNTLATLRALPPGTAGRAAFAGFGDPQFGPPLAVAAAPEGLTLRMRSAALPQGAAENWVPYSRLAPLPDTREEILAIAGALKADARRDVFLGGDASKQNLQRTDLSRRRIVAFATHGLTPGDFPDLDQPALALAAPTGNAEEGLLTLADILSLRLDADWVVLSACNTAAGNGTGADAISGLGRGFFYAGSRALLVTHWPVETRSARELVTALFDRYTTQSVSRAEALQQASLAVMEKTAPAEGGMPAFSYAHPLFWAPYALVGDGGR